MMGEFDILVASDWDWKNKLTALGEDQFDDYINNESVEKLREILDRVCNGYVFAFNSDETEFYKTCIQLLLKKPAVFEEFINDQRLCYWLSNKFNPENLLQFIDDCFRLKCFAIYDFDQHFEKAMTLSELPDLETTQLLQMLLCGVLEQEHFRLSFKKSIVTITDRFLHGASARDAVVCTSLLAILLNKKEIISTFVTEEMLKQWMTCPTYAFGKFTKLLSILYNVDGVRYKMITILQSSTSSALNNIRDLHSLVNFLNYVDNLGDVYKWHEDLTAGFVDLVVQTAVRLCVDNLSESEQQMPNFDIFGMLNIFWAKASYPWQLNRYYLIFSLLCDGEQPSPTLLYLISQFVPSDSIEKLTRDLLKQEPPKFDDRSLLQALNKKLEWVVCFGAYNSCYEKDSSLRFIAVLNAYQDLNKFIILAYFAELNFEQLIQTMYDFPVLPILFPIVCHILKRYPQLIVKAHTRVIDLLDKLKKKKVPTATLR